MASPDIDVKALQSPKVLEATSLLARRPGEVSGQASALKRLHSNAFDARLGQAAYRCQRTAVFEGVAAHCFTSQVAK